MQVSEQKINLKSFKKASKFDLNHSLQQLISSDIKYSQQQLVQLNSLIVCLECNGRQKLKHYRKVLQSNNSLEVEGKKFINKYLKSIFLQQYIEGNTQSKTILINLLKALDIITFNDIKQVLKKVHMEGFAQVKAWSEVIDLLGRNFQQKITNHQYQQLKSVFYRLISFIIEGRDMICRNQFKTKWLTTYTEILRTGNVVTRVFAQFISQQTRTQLITSCRLIIQKSNMLSKQVITQVFLLLIFLNPQQSQPKVQNTLCTIHYLHAQSIILHKPNLKQLIQLIPRLKQAQQKCQIVQILQQSFVQYYHLYDQTFRSNCFDLVINLFQVGRSIYGFLEHIAKIIIEKGDPWNMEGNFVRKFFIATIVLKISPSHQIISRWPTIIEDVIVQCGNINVPYANQCARFLFQKLYQQSAKDYNKWSSFWIDTYKDKLLNSNEKVSIRGVIEFINPILLKICPQPYLLRDLLLLSEKQPLELGVISLIKCYKQLGQIQIDEKKQIFYHVLQKNISFSYQRIRNFLLSNDQMITIQAFQLISCSLKPSELIKPMQMKLCLQFYQYSLKTSIPEYRKNYLGVTKKLFERIRNIYDSQLTAMPAGKKPTEKKYFTEFTQFLGNLVSLCFQNVFPDAIFELVNPALQILQLLQTYFGNRRTQVKKCITLQPSGILYTTQFYNYNNFQNLLSCLQSSYESVRKLAHELLYYYQNISRHDILIALWNDSLVNTNKLAIRNYQYACRVLTYLSQMYPNLLDIPKKTNNCRVNALNYFLSLIKQRYIVFKEQFIKQGSDYYKNLIHGILTIFSYILDGLAEQLKNDYDKCAGQAQAIKVFLHEFFLELINILNFSVEISSSNVSTVVLDTLTQPSQTEKKLKVDCRGHFLSEDQSKGTNIGTFLESTALISSMQDDEQGIQNTLVVSFYLLTREAGLVFQSIGGLLQSSHCSQFIPSDTLVKLINTYFFALINLKHMGSVDRISKGLGKMARIIFDHQSKELSQLPQILLDKLLSHLKSGSFTNILRRSAGVPYAFSCLLKSQSLKRNKLVEKSVTLLLQLSNQSKQYEVELRIHSLNILKKLFQDSDLKFDLDPYVSDAFVSSIKGFTGQDWGVRNSSLMLFSTLANRTVGIKPTYNLLEFFHKCPSLLDFVQKQLYNFNIASLNSMYPPLYPIVLLFSRLLPFDLKQKARLSLKGTVKQIRKQELLSLLPILDKSGLNNNYMGRVMTAKAILPFMQIDQITETCVSGLQQLPKSFNIQNNLLHYQLTKYSHLLLSYKEICKTSLRPVQISSEILQRVWNFMDKNIQKIVELNCPVVQQGFFKIFAFIFDNFNQTMKSQFKQQYHQVLKKINLNCRKITNKYLYQTQNFVIPGDLGHSMMRMEVVSLQIDLLIKYSQNFEEFKNKAIQFVKYLSLKLSKDENFFSSSDNEICQFYLQKILQNIKNLKKQQQNQLFKSLKQMLQKLCLFKINSNIILSKVLELRIATKFISSNPQNQNYLLISLSSQSQNHFLKIAIFKYLTTQEIDPIKIYHFLVQFSNPKSLQQLRECVIQYFHTQQHYNDKWQLIYLRLIEDEQYEIRKQMASIISKQKKYYQLNQYAIKQQIIKNITVDDFEDILCSSSDYNIKRKNHQEQRIFSYDKPNKFRSDISTIFQILINNDRIYEDRQKLRKAFVQIMSKKQFQAEISKVYSKNVLTRNQYQFELILRRMIVDLAQEHYDQLQFYKQISNSHEQLKKVFQKLAKKLNIK